MAMPGTGFRSANSLAIEISLHLVQPYVSTTILSVIASSGSQNVQVQSTSAMYINALLVADTGLSEEVIQISAINNAVSPPTITATFALPHAANTPLLAATFPIQAATDPIYTQAEILSYIARAQNEFLSAVPCIFALNYQQVLANNVLQQLTCDAIEMHRVAASNSVTPLVSLTRAAGIVTAVSSVPHGLVVGESFAVFGGLDPSFDGSFSVAAVVSPTSWTYPQDLPNSTSTGGNVGLWTRLYEVSQEQLYMQNPAFRSSFITSLRSWFQDRTGLYQFGVGPGKPSANVPIEVLVSIRDTDVLQLTDYFLVPDVLLHYCKYKALQFIWEKDGVAADPKRAAYARLRYERGVMATRRWMGWSGAMGMAGAGQQQAAMTGKR